MERPKYSDGNAIHEEAVKIQQKYWDIAGRKRIDSHRLGGNAGLFMHQVVRENPHFQKKAKEEHIRQAGKKLLKAYYLGETAVYVGARLTQAIAQGLLKEGVKKLITDNNSASNLRHSRFYNP